MKRIFIAPALLLCLTASVIAGDIDGTGKTPPPPPPPACTENCTSAQHETTEDSGTIEIIELLITLLTTR